MKIKLKQVVQSQNAIQVLSGEKLPLKLGWRIQKNVRRLTPKLEEYNLDNVGLFKIYGVEDEPKGCGKYKLLPENATAYEEEMKPVLEHEIELDIEPILLSLFDFAPDPKYPADKYRPQPGVLLDLDWMFVDDLVIKPPELPQPEKETQND